MRRRHKENLLQEMIGLLITFPSYIKKDRKRLVSVLVIFFTFIAYMNPEFIIKGFADVVPKAPDAPHTIIAYPQSDFVVIEGYTEENIQLTVNVIHATRGGGIVTSVEDAIPYDDPATPEKEGQVEVNHPGAAGICWKGVTPDIVPGDVVQVVVEDLNNTILWIDQITVHNITTEKAEVLNENTVVVHGTAQYADGQPIPVEQLEHRLINGDNFPVNGKNTLRAPGDDGEGTLAYDEEGSIHWTATYTGLDPLDIERALAADSVALWLGGADPGAATELTIFEVGDDITGGPQPPCTEPLELLPPPPGSELEPPTKPEGLTAQIEHVNSVNLTWQPSTDNVGVTGYIIFRDNVMISNVSQYDEAAPVPTTFKDINVPAGNHEYSVLARDAVGNRSVQSEPVSVSVLGRPADNIEVNEPPAAGLEIIPFPSRDFISALGYLETDTVDVEVIRNGFVVSTASNILPHDDTETPGFDGVVEVNHPGEACWEGVTPDLRAGDIIRLTAKNPDGTIRTVDQTTVANVVTKMAIKIQDSEIDPLTGDKHTGIIEIHGIAMGFDGKPIPLTKLEQRLVNGKDRFDYNGGRRTLRAGGGDEVLDGIVKYDPIDPVTNPIGINWTARYEGLSAEDVRRALEAESRIYWLGNDPNLATELTIYENGLEDPPGPAVGTCSPPIEPIDTLPPSVPIISGEMVGETGDTIQLTWEPASDDWYVSGYEIVRNDMVIARVGADTSTFTDLDLLPGNYKYEVRAFDSASARDITATTATDQIYKALGNDYGNFSLLSNPVVINISGTIPPSKPKDLIAKMNDAGSVELTWKASNDDSGIENYQIYRDGILIGETTENRFTDGSQLTRDQQYQYTVQAKDIDANLSVMSDPAFIHLTDVDTVSPEQPILKVSIPDIHGKDVKLTWSASADNIGVTYYQILRDGIGIGFVNYQSLHFIDQKLAAGTYKYTIVAFDSYGNASLPSNEEIGAIANDPPELPHRITVYPSRDAVVATGYAKDKPVTVSVLRKDIITGEYKLVSSTDGIMPFDEDPDTPGFDGTIEVNVQRPAATTSICWRNVTPDIRPFDIVRVTQEGIPDQLTVSYVKGSMPTLISDDTIVIRGVAMDESGNPIPIDQIDTEGGAITYDGPNSIYWTSTFSGLTQQEVAALMQPEVNVTWLGRNGINSSGNEVTIFENNPEIVGGPNGTCATESPAPLMEEDVAIVNAVQPISFDDQAVLPDSESAAKTFTLMNSGKINLNIDNLYLVGTNSQDFTFTNECPQSLLPGNSCSVSVTFKPTSIGNKSAAINILTNAYNTPYVVAELTGKGIQTTAPDQPSLPAQGLVTNSVMLQDVSGSWKIPVEISWNGPRNGTVTGFELQQKTDNGTFVDVPLTDQMATAIKLTLEIGSLSLEKRYQFRVRACNGENCSAWSDGEQFSLVAVDNKDTSSLSFRGKWREQTVSGTYRNTVHYVAEANDRVDLRKLDFESTGSIAFVTTKGTNRGSVSFSVDGGNRSQAISLNSNASLLKGQVVYVTNNLESGRTHDIQVFLNNNNRVDFDAFVLIK